jgi:hypothetical protein
LTIRKALCAAEALRSAIYTEWGVTDEQVREHVENLKMLYGDDEDDEENAEH